MSTCSLFVSFATLHPVFEGICAGHELTIKSRERLEDNSFLAAADACLFPPSYRLSASYFTASPRGDFAETGTVRRLRTSIAAANRIFEPLDIVESTC